MEKREKILRRVALKCLDFARQLSYFRALTKYDDLSIYFWLYMHNNAIYMAVLDWFHLFGYSKDSLHWEKVIKDKKDFKQGLLTHLEIDEQTWQSYWKMVKKYRDKDVAHIEMRLRSHVPEMSMAINATNYYYETVLRELSEYSDYSGWTSDLIKYHQEYLEESKKIVLVAFEATKHIKECVFIKRIFVSEGDLLKRMNSKLSEHEECIDCRFESVLQLKKEDEDGCNWSTPTLRCSGVPTQICMPLAQKIVTQAMDK